ncbi:hypothetical protein Bbelb_309700 [Branchiostoma belcheri]|nr:hypothetical protein Bbelb_309700 [Branchiostoma belcheri]
MFTDNELSSIQVSVEEVFSVLNGLHPNKAPGPDSISNRLLKEAAPVICTSLCELFNHSLATGQFPAEWKLCNVSPIYKRVDRTDPSNYRPIALLPTVAKVLERLVHNHLYTHLMNNNLMNVNQSGFKKGDGTVLQLLRLVDNWAKSINDPNTSCTAAVFLDVRRAFDTEVASTVNTDLQIVSTWFNDWSLQLHPDKCKVICIKSPQSRVQLPPIYISGQIVEQVPTYTHLGLTVHQSLRWTEHAQLTSNKARRTMGLLWKLRGKLSQEALELAYFTLIRPKLEYASILLTNITAAASKILERVQYHAGRLVSGAAARTPYSEILHKLSPPRATNPDYPSRKQPIPATAAERSSPSHPPVQIVSSCTPPDCGTAYPARSQDPHGCRVSTDRNRAVRDAFI